MQFIRRLRYRYALIDAARAKREHVWDYNHDYNSLAPYNNAIALVTNCSINYSVR